MKRPSSAIPGEVGRKPRKALSSAAEPHFVAVARRRAGKLKKGAMKASLDHLPPAKQRELAFVVETLRVGFAQALSRRTMPRFRNGKLLKIILFGSYARGDWVEDPKGRYFSDYDILVVVNHEDLTDLEEFWRGPDETFLREYAASERLRTQVNFIVHDHDDVNEQLRLGRYFFTDLLRDGITLFEEDGFPFVKPEALSLQDALSQTEGYFKQWFTSAEKFLLAARFMRENAAPKEAAFQLHQSAERFFHALLLTLSLYSPKTHRLNLLRDRAEELDRRVGGAFPGSNKFERRCFDLIRRAYVEARYSPHYEISNEQLQWLEERVAILQSTVETICQERIETLRMAAE